jgi:hypothetical protein
LQAKKARKSVPFDAPFDNGELAIHLLADVLAVRADRIHHIIVGAFGARHLKPAERRLAFLYLSLKRTLHKKRAHVHKINKGLAGSGPY